MKLRKMTDLEADLMIAKARIEELERERDILEKRLRHLLESKTICMFDELKPRTGEYLRDIKTLDARRDQLLALEKRYKQLQDDDGLTVLYICDRQKCERCNPDCKYTTNVSHAKKFKVNGRGRFLTEREAKHD